MHQQQSTQQGEEPAEAAAPSLLLCRDLAGLEVATYTYTMTFTVSTHGELVQRPNRD